MRLLTTSMISSLSLLLILEYIAPVAMGNDKQNDDALLQIEEELYNLVKEDVKDNNKEKEVKQEVKKGLRPPCGFGGECGKRRRRSVSRRRSLWGKKRQIAAEQEQHQSTTKRASMEDDEFEKTLKDLDKLVENLKDSRKRS